MYYLCYSQSVSLLCPARHRIIKDSLPLRLAEAPSEPSSPSPRTIEVHFLLKARDLPCTHALFEVRTRAVTQEEMLKMKDDPDELLKTKGKFRTKNINPDELLKTKELR
jgi:hypothetical protein